MGVGFDAQPLYDTLLNARVEDFALALSDRLSPEGAVLQWTGVVLPPGTAPFLWRAAQAVM